MERDHNNIMNISKNTLGKEQMPGARTDNSLIKLLGTSFYSPTRDMVVNSEESEGLSLSDLFEKVDTKCGSSLFGSSGWDLQSHSNGEEEELLRSKQKAVKEAYEKWQGSGRSYVQGDDELLNLSASLSDLCACFTDLINKSNGQFHKYRRASPSKFSNATLQHEIQRLANMRRELLKAHDPKAVRGKTLKVDEKERAQRQKSRSDRSMTVVDAVAANGSRAAGQPAQASKRETPEKNISDITMSPFRSSGLPKIISDITLSPLCMESPQRNLSSALHRALADGTARCLPKESANKCDRVSLHAIQKSELSGPEHHLKKQESCHFSPRKPKRSSVQQVVSKLEGKTNGGRRETLCRPTRKVSSDNPTPNFPELPIDVEDASHEEAVVVCPARPTRRTAVTDSCPLQSGFDDRTILFRRSQSTPVVTAEKAAPPKPPNRDRSPTKTEDSSHGRRKSSEPMLPSPSSPRRIKVDRTIAQSVGAGLFVASNQGSGNPVQGRFKSAKGLMADSKVASPTRLPVEVGKEKFTRMLRKESKSKSSRHLGKSPQATSERQLKDKQKSWRSVAVAASPAKQRKSARRLLHVSSKEDVPHNNETAKAHCGIKSQAYTDSENWKSPRLVSDLTMGRVQQLVSKLNHTDVATSSKGHDAAKRDETPKTPKGKEVLTVESILTPKKKEIVLPHITDCFVRIPSEGNMTSSTSESSRDVAPVTPRRFRTSFTTSNSCRGFYSRCEQDEREAISKEQGQHQHQQKQHKKEQQRDIFLPSLASADESRDYNSKSLHLSLHKVPPMTLRTPNSCRQFFLGDESVSNDSAPVSPRRSAHSPRRWPETHSIARNRSTTGTPRSKRSQFSLQSDEHQY